MAAYTELITSFGGRYARLYAKELIARYPIKTTHIWSIGSRPAASRLPPNCAHLGSVVGALLSSSNGTTQQWGLELLTTLVKQQHSAEFIGNFELFVPLLCSKAGDGGSTATTPTTTTTATATSSSSSIPKETTQATENTAESRNLIAALALQTLLEHMRYCFRICYVSMHLDTIMYTVLSILDAEDGTTTTGTAAALKLQSPSTAAAAAVGLNPALLSKQSISARVGTATTPALAAVLVYQELGHMTRDAAEGKKMLEFLFRFLDQRPQRWLGGAAVEIGIGGMREACSQEHQRYLLAAALLSHVGAHTTTTTTTTNSGGIGGGSASLTPMQRKAVLAEAMKDATALEQSTAPSILLFALQQLPFALMGVPAATQSSPEMDELRQEVLAAVQTLAARVGNRLQLTSVLGAAMSRIGSLSNTTTTPILQCCAAASSAYSTLPGRAAGASSPSHLPNVLLRSVFGVCLRGQPRQRLLAHSILKNALDSIPQGSYPVQMHLLLSSLWYESIALDNAPENYVALDVTFGAAVAAAGGVEEQLEACQLVEALQNEVLTAENGGGGGGEEEDDGSQLAKASSAQRWAVAALCSSMWMRLAQKLRCPSLESVALLNKCTTHSLSGLSFDANGLRILTTAAAASPSSSSVVVERSTTAEGCTVFEGEADETKAAQQLSAISASKHHLIGSVLANIPAFKHLSPSSTLFSPLPSSFIAPQISLAAPNLSAEQQQPVSARARRLQAAFTGATTGGDGYGGGSSCADTTTPSDMAVFGSRFAVDANGMDGAESVGGRSLQGIGNGSRGAAEAVGDGLVSKESPSLAEVLAGVEAALALNM